MRDTFATLLTQAAEIQQELRFNFLLSMQRAILQHAAITACEFYISGHDDPEIRDALDVMRQLVKPNDRTPIDILDCLIPRIRAEGWTSCGVGWFEPTEAEPASLRHKILIRNS